MAALGRSEGYPKGRPRVTLTCSVERLKRAGHANREIARRLGISETAVRKRLRRAGWVESTPEQKRLPLEGALALPPPPVVPAAEPGCEPNLSAFCAEQEEAISFDHDPADRRLDRLMAYLVFLDDAAPLFRSERSVPRAGVLLAVAPLLASGVFECARDTYGTLAPAFYGLRTSLLTMLLMALLRIKRP
ncbi:MAG: winged helix-turn-helix transcriptional regulator, partial [Opitutaceae bacterium]|nr:winged helix-turn-helix transcriptional regulator [Opitutaceae bacterium]